MKTHGKKRKGLHIKLELEWAVSKKTFLSWLVLCFGVIAAEPAYQLLKPKKPPETTIGTIGNNNAVNTFLGGPVIINPLNEPSTTPLEPINTPRSEPAPTPPRKRQNPIVEFHNRQETTLRINIDSETKIDTKSQAPTSQIEKDSSHLAEDNVDPNIIERVKKLDAEISENRDGTIILTQKLIESKKKERELLQRDSVESKKREN